MNIYRNKKTGAIIEIPSEIGSDEVWAKIGSSSEPVVPEEKEEKEVKAPAKKTTRKVSK